MIIHMIYLDLNSEWVAYLCALLLPFVQEDAAVLAAAASSVSGMASPVGLFAAITVGLTISDLWKYWLGRAALTQPWARKYAENERVTKTKDAIVNNLGKSLIIARFIPGARIPLYIAAGLFKASFVKFAAFILLSALMYISIAFALFHILGEVAGESAKKYLPVIAIIAIIILLAIKISKRFRAASESE